MILFHAKRDGTVTTTPDLVPQGSSMQDLVVVSEFDYAYCAIKLLPASGEYIEDVPCTPIPQKDFSTIFTASLPPKATVVAGSVDYQLVFTAADGTTQTTLVGSFTVPRGVPVSTPGSVEELSVKTVGDLYTIMANIYGLFVGHEGNIYKNTEDIAALKKTIASAGYVTIPVTEWEDSSPTVATFTLDGFGAGMTAVLIPADGTTQTIARDARLSAFPATVQVDKDTQLVNIIRANADKAPVMPLRFAYMILKTSDTTVSPTVAIIGVDAYGEGCGGSGEGGSVNPEIINQVLAAAANAEASKVAAEQNAEAAANAALVAIGSADSAGKAKTAAEQAAINAASSASAASTSATNAGKSATAAATSAQTASTAATNATSAKTAAETAQAAIVDELAKHGQLKPEFANDTSECTDTSRLYVLPDGYIYGYMKKSVAIKHRVDNATLKTDKRLGNNQSMTTYTKQNGNATTEPIAVDNTLGTYTINISGISMLYPLYYAPLFVYYFDADGNFIANKGAKQLGLTTNNEANLPIPESGVFTFNIVRAVESEQWARTKYICLVLGLAAGTSLDSNPEVVKNVNINIAPLDSYETLYNWYSTGHMFNTDDYGQAIEKNAADIVGLDERVSEVEKKIEEGLPSTGTDTSPLFNKLGLIGDSLTNQIYQGWQALVVSMLNIPEWHKNAISGSTVARYPDTIYTPFVERYLDTPEDCDCVVIMGGTNDSSKDGEYMGEVGVLNNDTFKGAYSTIIEGLLARNPATRVMLMTPPRSYSTSLVLHERIGKYAEATKEIAKYYGLPCLDFYDTLGWNACTAEWCSWDFAVNDTVHFSMAIGPRVGRMVANFIRNNY